MANQAPKQVAIWLRVSTEDQVRGESPETHERRARLYAEAKGWNVVEVYRLDAVSGKTVKEHPETKRMLADIKAGAITGLIFSKLARLARNTKELLEFADLFNASGADLISLAESIDTSTPAGRLFYTMIAAMAQWEREEIASRVLASVPVRAKLGKPLGGAATFGYQWKDGKLIPDPNEAPVRVLVYELFKEHKRKKTVARLLNAKGYRTRGGAAFSDTTIDRLIQDTTAKGIRRANYTRSENEKTAWKLKPKEEWVELPVEAIVTPALWDECNGTLLRQKEKGKRPAKRSPHLFTGITFCHCGTKMYVASNQPNKYVCQACRNKIPIDDLEAVFHEQLRSFFFSDEELALQLRASDQDLIAREELLAILINERKKLSGEIDKLHDLYQSGMIDKTGFGAKYHPLAARCAQLDDEIPRAQAELDVRKISYFSREEIISEARDLYSRWTDLSHAEKRQIVEAIAQKIVVGDGDIEIELFYDPTPPTGTGGTTGTPGGGTPPVTPQTPGRLATRAHGFIAAINWKRAGNSACRAAREITMRPVSSGSRSASSALRWNSGNSSRNSTPWCASEISPGLGGEPPPTSAADEAVWCGARSTRWPQAAGRNAPVRLSTAADSRASSWVIGGSSPAKRCASIDLPVPGEPSISTLWPPAAAISSARLAADWPFTSRRSGRSGAGAAVSATARGSGTWFAASGGSSAATTSSRCVAPWIDRPSTSAASQALAHGSTSVRALSPALRRSASAIASAPRTGRNAPPRASSPANSKPPTRAASSCPLAARMPSAIGKSKRPDSFGRSAGARLTVMRLFDGNSSPLFWIAARTRSRASLTSTSARPTSVKLGSPLARWTSTVTSAASSACSARLCMTASDMFSPRSDCARCRSADTHRSEASSGNAPSWCHGLPGRSRRAQARCMART